jgi:glycosyltransferase involved in cell wall biosynthesis
VLNLMLGARAGGLETMAANYHRALAARGAQVRSAGRAGGWFAGEMAGEDFVALGALDLFGPVATPRLRQIQQAFGPDLVLAHGARALSAALRLRPTAAVVAVVHNFRARPELARARAAICVSAAVDGDVRRRFPGLTSLLVENFAPLKAGAPRTAFSQPARIGSIGRLHANKGCDVLLDAAAILRGAGRAFELTIAGAGPDAAALRAQAERLGVAGQVRFPGWVDPEAALAGMDIFISASRVEPFGLVLIEAMAAGAPVVATDIDGPRDILQRGDLGVLTPAGDPKALALAIESVLGDPAAALARAGRAQAAALSRHGMAAGAERLETALMQAGLVRRY